MQQFKFHLLQILIAIVSIVSKKRFFNLIEKWSKNEKSKINHIYCFFAIRGSVEALNVPMGFAAICAPQTTLHIKSLVISQFAKIGVDSLEKTRSLTMHGSCVMSGNKRTNWRVCAYVSGTWRTDLQRTCRSAPLVLTLMGLAHSPCRGWSRQPTNTSCRGGTRRDQPRLWSMVCCNNKYSSSSAALV